MMKRIICVVLAILAITGCGKKKIKALDISGDWKLVSIESKARIGNEEIDVYLRFDKEGTFEMYQMLGTGRYRQFKGSWQLTESILSGTYADGSAWGSSYEVTLDEGKTLTLASTSGNEVDVYQSSTIPNEVIATAE